MTEEEAQACYPGLLEIGAKLYQLPSHHVYVGQQLASEGLTEEEAQACIDHFSPYIEWRDVAVKHEFQALMLAEAQEEVLAYEA